MEKREAQLDARLAEYARAENWSKVLEELDRYEKKNERRHAKHRAGLDITLADREPSDDEFYRRRSNKHWSVNGINPPPSSCELHDPKSA